MPNEYINLSIIYFESIQMLKILSALLVIFFLHGCGGAGDNSSESVTPTNTSPQINIGTSYSIFEGDEFSLPIVTSDADGDSINLSISGNDVQYFSLVDDELSLASVLDFENLVAQNGGNVLQIIVSASDGNVATTQTIQLTVQNAIEGRIIDGPVSGAKVFLDINNNLLLDDDESFFLSNTDGYFKLKQNLLADTRLVSVGGIDTISNKVLSDIVLAFPVSPDSNFVNVTPISTLVALSSPESVQAMLNTVNNSLTVEELLNTDTWEAAEQSSQTAQQSQVLNNQILSVINSAKVITGKTAAENLQAVVSSLTKSENTSLLSSLGDADSITQILTDVIIESSNITVDENLVNLVAQAVAKTNAAVENNQDIITSQAILQVVSIVQDDLPNKVRQFVNGEITVDVFIEQSNTIDNSSIIETDTDDVKDTGDASPIDTTESVYIDEDTITNNKDTDDNNSNGALNNTGAEDSNEIAKDTDTDTGAEDSNEIAKDTDTDKDGIKDNEDAFPLDASESIDTDRDGIGNNADPDDDNDSILDEIDLFPLIAISGRLDTDSDGAPDECFSQCLSQGLLADLDDDNDGLLDIRDEFPTSSGNVTDIDSDGIFDVYDVAPNDPTIAKALKFNLSSIQSFGIKESISPISTGELSWYKKAKATKNAPFQLIKNAYAQDSVLTLANQTNVVAVSENGSEADDAILASSPTFIAESILSPDGKALYLLTSQHIQNSITGLPVEICNLYKVIISTNQFSCILDNEQIEPGTALLNTNSRTWFDLKGIQFRADNTGIFTHNDDAYLLRPNNSVEKINNNLTTISGSNITVSGLGWLDDEHVFVVNLECKPDSGGCDGYNILAINVADNVIVNSASRDDGYIDFGSISQSDGIIYAGQRAVSWNGIDFIKEQGGGIEVVVDKYNRAWAFDDAYGGRDTKKLNLLNDELSIPLTQGPVNSFNDALQSGTGSNIKYKNFAFEKDVVLHKYSRPPRTPIVAIDGKEYRESGLYELSDNQGFILVDNRKAYWYYLPKAQSSGDISITYTVQLDEGTESRQFVIPSYSVSSYLVDNPTPVNPNDYLDDLRKVTDESLPKFATPESERSSFCLYSISDEKQVCAKLEDYNSLVIDQEMNSGRNYLPTDLYVCPDGSCNAFPGIQNLVLSGERFYVYFKDSNTHQYYQASGLIDEFFEKADRSLNFKLVKNGAGESEIIANANSINATADSNINDISVSYENQKVIISIGQNLSKYSPKLDVSIEDSDGNKILSNPDGVWNTNMDTFTIPLSLDILSVDAKYSVLIDGFMFKPNDRSRYSFNGRLLFTAQDTSGDLLDDDNDGYSNAREIQSGSLINDAASIPPLCPAGKYSDYSDGRTSCSECSVGTYQPAEGQSVCLTPTDTQFVDNAGATNALDCPNDYIANNNFSACVINSNIGSDNSVNNSNNENVITSENNVRYTGNNGVGDYCNNNYCYEYPDDGEVQYHYALDATPTKYVSGLPSDFTFRLGDGPIVFSIEDSEGSFTLSNVKAECIDDLDACNDEWQQDIDEDIVERFRQGLISGEVTLSSPKGLQDELIATGSDVEYRHSMNSYNGKRVSDIEVVYPVMLIHPVLSGSGTRSDGECSTFDFADIFNINDEGIRYYADNKLAQVQGSIFNRFGMTEGYICSDAVASQSIVNFTAIDGVGGKRDLGAIQVIVSDTPVSGGGVELKSCFDDYCAISDGKTYYHYALNEDEEDYPYHFTSENDVVQGSYGASTAGFLLREGDSFITISSSNNIGFSEVDLNRVIQASEGLLTMKQLANSALSNSIYINRSGNEVGGIFWTNNSGIDLADYSQDYAYASALRVVSGSGTGTDWDQDEKECSDFSLGSAISGLDDNRDVYLVAKTRYADLGATEALVSNNNIVICSDTPAGVYPLSYTMLDGKGGRKLFTFELEVLTEYVNEGRMVWSVDGD